MQMSFLLHTDHQKIFSLHTDHGWEKRSFGDCNYKTQVKGSRANRPAALWQAAGLTRGFGLALMRTGWLEQGQQGIFWGVS